MGRLTAFLLARFRHWDRNAQIGFALAFLLLAPALLVVAFGPESLRTPSTIGAMGLVIAAQAIWMWANRGMVTEYTTAQRLYLRGDFASARDVLEPIYTQGTKDIRELTLLGNIYRQLGQIDKSGQVLSEALDIQPDHYFPLYGFGRTLLISGRYAEAVTAFERAVANGAPSVIRFDLGEAQYRAGDEAQAVGTLAAVLPDLGDEPHRLAMAALLLHRMGERDRPTAAEIEPGLAYWQAELDRFSGNPYADSIAYDLDEMMSLSKET